MKKLAWVVGVLIAVVGLFASVLNIVDYALNKPAVIDATFGPMNRYYEQWVQIPVGNLIRGIAESVDSALLNDLLFYIGITVASFFVVFWTWVAVLWVFFRLMGMERRFGRPILPED